MKTKEIAVFLYPTNHKTRPILLIINYIRSYIHVRLTHLSYEGAEHQCKLTLSF